MAAVDVAGEPHQRAARVGPPVGGEQTRERGHDVGATVVVDRRREGFDLGGGVEHPQVVAQPLHQRPRHRDGTLQRVDGFRVADLVAQRRQQPVLGGNDLLAGVHEHETAGAVGVLRHAFLETGLPEGRGLLVTEDARDRDTGQETLRATHAVDLGRGPDLRQHRHRNAHVGCDGGLPVEGLEVHQHGAGGIGDIGDVHTTVHTPGEVPQHPGVHGAHHQVTGLGAFPGALDVVEDPLDLRPGEVGGQRQPDELLVPVGSLLAAEFLDDLLGAGVLPDDGVVDGLTGFLVPHEGGLALVGDTDRDQIVLVQLRLRESLGDDLTDVAPDLDGIVLHPPGAGKNLLVFFLSDGDDAPFVVEDDRARRSGSLVDGEYVCGVCHVMAPS